MTEADAQRLAFIDARILQAKSMGTPQEQGLLPLYDVLLLRLLLDEATAWQPIETAPHDPEFWIIGLGRFPNGGSRVQEDPAQGTACHWDGEFWADDNGTTYNLAWWVARPTLPPPPEDKE